MVLRKRQLEGQNEFKLSNFNQMIIYLLYEEGFYSENEGVYQERNVTFSITRKINRKENLSIQII